MISFRFLLGYKTLWWNQRVRLQKLQSSALSQMRLKGPRYSVISKGSPKQAVCPFCFKVFYDKSTMNRHVSKRVCLGLQFPSPDFAEDAEMVSEIPLSGVESPIRPSTPSMSVEPIEPSEIEVSDDSPKLPSAESKSNKIPCPYCKKLMKGERGVRKHIDFYGCPMAFGSKVENEDD